MHVAKLVQRFDPLAGVDEDLHQRRQGTRQAVLQRHAVEELHQQDRFVHLAKQRAIGLHIDARGAGFRGRRPLADFVFILKLLDEARVFVGLADDVLQRVELFGLGVAHGVDQARGAFADVVDHIVIEDRLGHARGGIG